MTLANRLRAQARDLGFYTRDYEVHAPETQRIRHHPARRVIYADDRHLAIKLIYATGYLA